MGRFISGNVVAAEMPAPLSWRPSKAQAVAARTYACGRWNTLPGPSDADVMYPIIPAVRAYIEPGTGRLPTGAKRRRLHRQDPRCLAGTDGVVAKYSWTALLTRVFFSLGRRKTVDAVEVRGILSPSHQCGVPGGEEVPNYHSTVGGQCP